MSKIVLTGGACGGKTEAINIYKDRLSTKYKVNVVPETASNLLNLGYLLEYPMDVVDFQDILFRIQLLNEYKLEQFSDILLCDRGLFDAMSYISEEQFLDILKRNNINYQELYNTYNLALYFKSIAHDNLETFKELRPYDKVSDTIRRDITLLNIWKELMITYSTIYTNDFSTKLDLIYEQLLTYLNTPKESETKLSDIYLESKMDDIKYSMEEVLDRNNIPKEIKTKTKGLIL